MQHPDRRRAITALGVTTTLLPLAAAAATGDSGPTVTAPSAPTSLSISLSGGPDGNGFYSYDASWSAPADDGGATIDLYEHGLWVDGAMLVSGTQLVTSTSYLEQPQAGEWLFRVRARNSVGWGPYAETPVPLPP